MRRISLSPLRRRARRGRRRRRGRAVVHFHGDVGQPAHRSRPRRTCAFPAGCPPCVSEIACCCDQAIITFAPSCRATRPRSCRSRSRRRRTRQFTLTLAKLPGRPAHRRSRGRARDGRRQGSRQRAGRIRARRRTPQRRDRGGALSTVQRRRRCRRSRQDADVQAAAGAGLGRRHRDVRTRGRAVARQRRAARRHAAEGGDHGRRASGRIAPAKASSPGPPTSR